MSRKEGEPQRKKSLCDFATLHLCVNKKRSPFKASFPGVDGLSGFARKKNVSQRSGDAKKEIPLRLNYFASLREKKSISDSIEFAEFQPGQFQFFQISIDSLKPVGPSE